jgi:hypothetical protein
MATADPGVIYKAHLGLNGKALLRHQMARRAYERGTKNESSPRIFLEEATLLLTPGERFYDVAKFERRSGDVANLTKILDGLEELSWHFILALILVTAAYGGIHLAAWQFEFATVTEKWLWRSSCLYIASFAGLAILVGVMTGKLYFGPRWGYKNEESLLRWPHFVPTHDHEQDVLHRIFRKWVKPTVYQMWLVQMGFILIRACVLVLGGLVYVFARIFLVIEFFISLRHVPIGLYAAVPWSNFIPHI